MGFVKRFFRRFPRLKKRPHEGVVLSETINALIDHKDNRFSLFHHLIYLIHPQFARELSRPHLDLFIYCLLPVEAITFVLIYETLLSLLHQHHRVALLLN